MKLLAEASTKADLDAVNWYIHDCIFEKDRIEWDPRSLSVKIPLAREAEKPSAIEGFLIIDGVEKVEIEDVVNVGWYDINKLDYEEPGSLVLSGNTPIEIRFRLSELGIAVSVFEE